MLTLLPPGKFSRFSIAVAAALTALLIFTILGPLPARQRILDSDLLQTAILLWAAYCALCAALRSTGILRLHWIQFAVALSFLAVAQALETYFQNFLRLSSTTPWPSDVFFLLWVTPCVMMLLPSSAGETVGVDWQQTLAFAQVVVVALALYLYFFYIPSRWGADGAKMVLRVFQVQIIRDAALGAAFAIQAMVLTKARRAFFACMAVFFVFSSGSELAFFFTSRPTSGIPGWLDIGWSAPYLLAITVASSWQRDDQPQTNTPRPRPRSALLSHFSSIAIPLLVLAMGRRIAQEESTMAWSIVAASFIISAARLILASEQERRLANNLLKAEQELVRSEKMFSSAFRLSPDPVGISMVPESRFVEVNDSFTRFTGYKREEVLGRTGEEMQLWADNDHRAQVMAKLREEKEVRQAEFRCRTKSGEIRIGQFSGTLIEINGQPHALVVIRDITDHKRAEEALRISEAKFRTVVEALHVGVVLLGAKAEILFVNRAAEEMFDIPMEKALGRNSSELGIIAIYEDGTEMPFPMRPGPQALATGEAVRNKVMGWRRPGSDEVLWILGEVVPLFGADGQVEKLVASFSDVTKRKQAEDALQRLSTRLLQLQDEERRRLGRELHDSLAQSVLAVNLNLAQVGRSSPPLDEKSRRAMAEARRVLQEMSQEIRTLSYLLHPPVLDELGLASAVKEYAKGFSERSGIDVDLDIQSGFARLSQEAETALFRIVQESLSNIQRHSGSATAKIYLRLDVSRIELEISDQGRGMDQKAVEHGRSNKTRLGVGILGMRERMTQLGGKLSVESNSSGTTIRAEIPLIVEVANVPENSRRG